MVLTQDEQEKLKLFSNVNLSREQTEALLGRLLTNVEFKSLTPKDYRKIFTPIAKQAAKQRYVKPFDTERDLQDKYKHIYSKIVNRKFKTDEESEDKHHFLGSLFKQSSDDFEITKTFEYYNQMYNTTLTHWRVTGSVNFFNIRKVMEVLVEKMTERYPSNTRIQIGIRTPSGREPHTNLISKDEATDMVAEWTNYFIDYYDMNIEDLTFKLTAIELPQGMGRKCNAIINLDDKRCITQIKNKDTICLVRAILVGLSYNKTKLEEVFKSKLNDQEIADINY